MEIRRDTACRSIGLLIKAVRIAKLCDQIIMLLGLGHNQLNGLGIVYLSAWSPPELQPQRALLV
jgi:hypothetical protein